MNKQFIKPKAQVTNKHKKRNLISLLINEMQSTTGFIHIHQTKKNFKVFKSNYWWGCEELETSRPLVQGEL